MSRQLHQSLSVLVLLFWLGVSAFMLFWASQITYDNEEWLPEDNPQQRAYDLLVHEFEGQAEQLLISIRLEGDFFTEKIIARLNDLSDALLTIDNVEELLSPLEATVIVEDGDFLQIQSYRKALAESVIPDYDRYKDLLTQSHYYGLLISQDYRIVTLSLKVDSWKDWQKRDAVMRAVRIHLLDYHDLGEVNLAGNMRLKHELDKETHAQLKRLLLLSSVVIIGFLLLLFGKFWRVGLLMSTATLCVLTALSLIVILGHHLTIIALTLPIMIIVIALADCLHMMGYWDNRRRHHGDEDPLASLKTVMRYGWRPCLNTSLTTSIGFGSFMFSTIIPLKQFGIAAAISVMLCYGVMMAMMASGLYYVALYQRRYQSGLSSIPLLARKVNGLIQNLLGRILVFVHKHSIKLMTLSLCFGLIIASALVTARTETNLLDVFFAKDSEIYQSFALIDEELGGSGSVDVIFLSADKGSEYFRQFAPFSHLLALEKNVKQLPYVEGVQSYLQPVREAHRKFSSDETLEPDSEEELGQELLFLDFSRSDDKQDVLAPYLDFNGEKIRMKIQLPNLSSIQLTDFLEKLDPLLEQSHLPSPLITGHSSFFQTLSSYVVHTQLSSVSLTLLVIGLVLALQFGARLAMLGIIVTSLPVLITLGTIALCGLPFDFATVIIAAIAIGIAVDDNIHILHAYQKHIMDGKDSSSAIEAALLVPGHAVLQTSILFILGTMIFTSSDLVILQRFGIFIVEALFLAWFSSTLLLPALLKNFTRKHISA